MKSLSWLRSAWRNLVLRNQFDRFDPGHVLNLTVDTHTTGLSEAQGRVFYPQLLGRIRTLPGVIATLGVVALLASYVPARRASRLDPLVALRSE